PAVERQHALSEDLLRYRWHLAAHGLRLLGPEQQCSRAVVLSQLRRKMFEARRHHSGIRDTPEEEANVIGFLLSRSQYFPLPLRRSKRRPTRRPRRRRVYPPRARPQTHSGNWITTGATLWSRRLRQALERAHAPHSVLFTAQF